jgi:hypothetical protein
MDTRCRWCDKPIIFWNERWSHFSKQDQKECPTPLPFEDDLHVKGPTLDSRKSNNQVDPSVCAKGSLSAKLITVKHACPDWDFLEIDETCPEFECCTCFEGDGF